MLKNDKQIENTNLDKDSKNDKIQINNVNYKIITEDIKIKIFRLIINAILSIILIAIFIYALITYHPQWRLFYFLASWSYLMSIFYIVSVTIIDFISILCKKFCNFYNNIIRNYFIRICIPFGITSAFVYWELVLMGNNFQKIEHDASDVCKTIFVNGIVQFFLFFDMFASPHIYKYTRIYDIIILTIILAGYYLLICLGKYLEIFEPYDFMKTSEVRQITAVGIIVYVLLLNGYIAFDLLAFYFFEKENDKNIYNSYIQDRKNNFSNAYIYNNTTNENRNLTQFPFINDEFTINLNQTVLNENNKINNYNTDKNIANNNYLSQKYKN